MILGIGVDIVHLPRIASLISRRGSNKLAKRILSSHELVEFHSRFPTPTSKVDQQLIYLGSK
jgi:holo-[acyl-carrier protein] synthase